MTRHPASKYIKRGRAPDQRLTEGVREAAAALAATGLKRVFIAQLIGVSPSRISQIAKEYGIALKRGAPRTGGAS